MGGHSFVIGDIRVVFCNAKTKRVSPLNQPRPIREDLSRT